MEKKIYKTRIGKTPLIRAYGLEKELGLEKIYLKLEGNNPSGHFEDRLAYLLIKDAINKKFDTICIGTEGTIGASLAYVSKDYNIKCKFVVNDKKKILRNEHFHYDHVELIEYGNNYNDTINKSYEISKINHYYNANPGVFNNSINMCVYIELIEEIVDRMKENVMDTIFIQTCNGYSVAGIHMGIKQKWIKEDLKNIPQILGITTKQGNAIYESYKKDLNYIETLTNKQIKKSKYNKNLIDKYCIKGDDALNAIYDSHGEMVGISDEELLENYKLFKKCEDFKVSINSFFSIAGFMKLAKEKRIENNKNYIIVVDDGKLDLDISVESRNSMNHSVDEISNYLKDWLGQFGDPIEEIKEAVNLALDKGFLLTSYLNSELVGACVVIPFGFEHFATKYHLAYIATKTNIKGKGIATFLIQKAAELAEGDISLHVEFENKRAIKLYEKMGFKKPYIRMIHSGK